MPHAKDDFDPKAITQEHQKDIGDLKRRVEELEAKFGTHEQIAETLAITAEKQVKMQGMITTLLTELIEKNETVKNSIKDLINKADRDSVKVIFKKIGWGVWLFVVSAISGVIGYFIKN